MARDLFGRYIWMIETIRRHGSLTRERLNELWRRSQFGNGSDMPRRTFYNYRNAIEELFHLSIECNPGTFEYSIRDNDSSQRSVTDMMLSSAAMSDALTDARNVSDRIFFEDVPSAHHHLATIISSLHDMHPVRFSYTSYYRSSASHGIVVEPYFLKIFRQRWYMTGRVVSEDKVKTYSLDRMSDVETLTGTFTMPDDFDPKAYVADAFGIVFNESPSREVVIRATPRQARYIRALPLHHSQQEQIDDNYSLFTYRLRLTPDLVDELMRLGNGITVVSPPELRAMLVKQLSDTLSNYQTDEN